MISILLFPEVRRSLGLTFRGHRMLRLPKNVFQVMLIVETYLKSALAQPSSRVTLPSLKNQFLHKDQPLVTIQYPDSVDPNEILRRIRKYPTLQAVEVDVLDQDRRSGIRRCPIWLVPLRERAKVLDHPHGVVLNWSNGVIDQVNELFCGSELIGKVLGGGKTLRLLFTADENIRIPHWAKMVQDLWLRNRAEGQTESLSPAMLESQFLEVRLRVNVQELRERGTRSLGDRRFDYDRSETLIVDKSTRELDGHVRNHQRIKRVIENGHWCVVVLKISLQDPKRTEFKYLCGKPIRVELLVTRRLDGMLEPGEKDVDWWVSIARANVLRASAPVVDAILRGHWVLNVVAVTLIEVRPHLILIPGDVYRFLDQWLEGINTDLLYVVGNKGLGKTSMSEELVWLGYHVFDSDLYGRVTNFCVEGMSVLEGAEKYLRTPPDQRTSLASHCEVMMREVLGSFRGNVTRDLGGEHSVILRLFQEMYGKHVRTYPITDVLSAVMKVGMEFGLLCDGGSVISGGRFAIFTHATAESDSGMAGICCRLHDDPGVILTLGGRSARGDADFQMSYALFLFYNKISSYVAPTFSKAWFSELIFAISQNSNV